MHSGLIFGDQAVSTRSGFIGATKPAPGAGAGDGRLRPAECSSNRSAGEQQEFSGGAAALQVLVGAAGVGERVPAADGDPQ